MTTTMTDASMIIRPAKLHEADLLRHMHIASLWCLDMVDHSAEEIGSVLREFPTVDADLIRSGRYYVAELAGEIVAGGGWSPMGETVRCDLPIAHGGRIEALLPLRSAMLRGVFASRAGLAASLTRSLMQKVEADAAQGGFPLAIMVTSRAAATGSASTGYRDIRPLGLQLEDGSVLPLLRLNKTISPMLQAVA